MIFEYRCPECRATMLSKTRGDRLDASCGSCGFPGPHVRVFSIRTFKPMEEHWNTSVNAPVRSMQDFKRQLKIKGDQYTESTGIEVNYQPVDMSDTKALGVTREGIEDKILSGKTPDPGQ